MARSETHRYRHSSKKKDATYSSVPFLNGPFQTLRDGFTPWILFVVSFGVYLATLQPWAFPGVPVGLTATIVGATPDLTPTHFLWKGLMRIIAGSGEGMVLRLNVASAFFSAWSVFFCYRVVLRLLTLAVEPTQIGKLAASRHAEAVQKAANACRIGAIAASLTLAFCMPIWISATRVYYHSFYLCWLLICAQFILSFSRTRKLHWLVLWGCFHAVGMTQTSAFIDFFPFMAIYFLYTLWADERIQPVRAIIVALLSMLPGLLVLFWSSYSFFHSEGCELAGNCYSVMNCISRTVSSLLNGTRGNLSQAPWLILIGLSVAPCLASLITARRALNGENTWSFLLLHAVIASIVVLDVIEFRASPWRFLGVSDSTIIPYLLIAATYGYATTYLHLLPFNLWASSDSPKMQRLSQTLGMFVTVVFLLLPVAAAVFNYREAGNRSSRIFRTYTDAILDSLDGRKWMVTDYYMDNMLLLRAKERNLDVHCVNPSGFSLRMARKSFEDVSLRNAANLGLQSLLQEWISKKEVATRDLVLVKFPDFWGLGGLEMLPNKLVFMGATQEQMQQLDIQKTVAEHEQVWAELKPGLDEMRDFLKDKKDTKVPGDAPSEILRWYLNMVLRPQLSFVGNNLGFSVSMMSRVAGITDERRKELQDTAYDIYRKVHELDPGNFSATLNWANKVMTLEPPEKQTEARQALTDLNAMIAEKLSAMQLVWSLARTFGYVEDPSFFAVLGWTWANTGQYNLAMQALTAAQDNMPEHAKNRIKSDIARLHLAAARPEESEKIYFEMLIEDPGNLQALMGLVSIYTFSGDTAKAREYLERAKDCGEAIGSLQIASAIIYSVEGDDVRARSILQDLVNTEPSNVQAWSMLCAILYEQKDSASMAEAVKKLDATTGSESYQALIAHAMLAELGGGETRDVESADAQRREQLFTARSYYMQALRTNRGNIALLDRILTLDFQLADKASAREHALTILRQDRGAAFANYILGSLAIDAADFKGAEDYLRRAVERSASISNLNDLADVLCRLGQYEEAALRIQQAFQMPDADKSYELWDTQGVLWLAQDKLEDAEMALKAALSIYGEDLRVHLHLADLYHRKGENRLATETVRSIAPQVDVLPRPDREQFEELHLKIIGRRYSKTDYQ